MRILCTVFPFLVSANISKSQTPSLALNPEAFKELLDLILVPDEMMLMPWEEFKPICVKHVRKTTSNIDENYSDEQIEAVLLHECDLARQYPETRKSGFKSHEACRQFAKKLAKARAEEVKTGNTAQYEQFCKEYHHHLQHDPEVPHGSKWRPEDGYVTPESRKPPPVHDHASFMHVSWCAAFFVSQLIVNS